MFGRDRSAAGEAGAAEGFRQLDAAGWVACFDRLAPAGGGDLVAVEVVASPAQAGHATARRLREIRYDAVDEVIEVIAGERAAGDRLVVRHLILDPRAIAVRDGARSFELAVLDASGVWTRIDVIRRASARPRPRARANIACVAGEGAGRRRRGSVRTRAQLACRLSARCGGLGRLRGPAARGARRGG